MKKIAKGLILIFIIFFFVTYIGRNNIQSSQSMILSEEDIARFEQDLREGKEIIPSNYMPKKKNYNNRASKVGLTISKGIEKVSNKILRKLLQSIINE